MGFPFGIRSVKETASAPPNRHPRTHARARLRGGTQCWCGRQVDTGGASVPHPGARQSRSLTDIRCLTELESGLRLESHHGHTANPIPDVRALHG